VLRDVAAYFGVAEETDRERREREAVEASRSFGYLAWAFVVRLLIGCAVLGAGFALVDSDPVSVGRVVELGAPWAAVMSTVYLGIDLYRRRS
jgi:hypothetical protein